MNKCKNAIKLNSKFYLLFINSNNIIVEVVEIIEIDIIEINRILLWFIQINPYKNIYIDTKQILYYYFIAEEKKTYYLKIKRNKNIIFSFEI